MNTIKTLTHTIIIENHAIQVLGSKIASTIPGKMIKIFKSIQPYACHIADSPDPPPLKT
jgi:hypothetical protein